MAIKVYPGVKRPTHHISLSDGVRTFGLRLEDGPRSIQEIPMTPSTVHFSGGGTKFGDWEPGMSHIEQRTWEGGRGLADFVDDPTRFFDSKLAWTLTPGKLFPVPRWKFSTPTAIFSEGYQNLPGDMDWVSMWGDVFSYQMAHSIPCSSGWAAYDSLWLWVRRIGNPGDLGVYLKADNGGEPGITKQSTTLDGDDYNEGEIYLVKIDMSGGAATIGTKIYITLVGNMSDDAANHWEIGVDQDGGGSLEYDRSSGGWGAADFTLYYRLLSAGANRKWHFFEFEGAMYAIDQQADGTASKLYLNGDRGKATGATSTTLTDSNQSWTNNQWVNAYVKIVAGTGKGQTRKITSNGATALGLAAWDITPDTTSEYVIYHTAIWQDISPVSGDQIDGVVRSVAIADDFVAFAQGQSVNILKVRWNPGASPPAHEFDDDGTNKADLLLTIQDENNEIKMYAANAVSAAVSRATIPPWLTDMTFETSLDVGDSSLPITSLYEHDGNIYAFKPDGCYQVVFGEAVYDTGKATTATATTLSDSDKSWTANEYIDYYIKIMDGTGKDQVRKITANTATQLTVATWTTNPDTTSGYKIFKEDPTTRKTLGDIGFIRSENNGQAVLSHGLYVYFSWGGYSLQRLYNLSGTYDLSNVGPDKDEGLPDDRRGPIVALRGTPPGIVAAVDGGDDKTSSILVQPVKPFGWHEIFQGPFTGGRVQNIYFQDSYRPRLWFDFDGELCYQDWPRHTFNPLKDSGLTFNEEAILVSSTIDMGVSSLPKYIESIHGAVENLASRNEIRLDYQINEDVGTTTWIEAGAFQINPSDVVEVNRGEVYRIRFRLRIVCNDECSPPIVNATVLEGFARTPIKYQWNMRVKTSSIQRDLSGVSKDADPDELLTWLKEAAVNTKAILMRSIWEQMDNKYVVVEPPTLLRAFTNNLLGYWGGSVMITVREK